MAALHQRNGLNRLLDFLGHTESAALKTLFLQTGPSVQTGIEALLDSLTIEQATLRNLLEIFNSLNFLEQFQHEIIRASMKSDNLP